MKTLASRMIEGLYSLNKENRECILALDTGGSIKLDMFVGRPRIRFISKDTRLESVGFITYEVEERRSEAYKTKAFLGLISDFYSFSSLYKHSFVNLLKMSEDHIRRGNTLPFFDFVIIDGLGLAFNTEGGLGPSIFINEPDFEKAKEGLLEFFREITKVTEGVELDENLRKIEV